MKPSEIVRIAADEFLWDGGHHRDPSGWHNAWSCCAIENALYSRRMLSDEVSRVIFNTLEKMGMDKYSLEAFKEFKRGEEQQSVRYAWLHFVADYLEENGQ